MQISNNVPKTTNFGKIKFSRFNFKTIDLKLT